MGSWVISTSGWGTWENAVHVINKSIMTNGMEEGKFLKERWGAINQNKIKG